MGRSRMPTDPDPPNGVGTVGRSWSPWRAVVGFGVVSLAADMVYEGARSVTGPLLASLGASAVLVGLISGAGEAMALLLRIFSGSWADRPGLVANTDRTSFRGPVSTGYRHGRW